VGGGVHHQDLLAQQRRTAITAARRADRHGGAGDVPDGAAVAAAHPPGVGGFGHLQLGEDDLPFQPAGLRGGRAAHRFRPPPEAGGLDQRLAALGGQPAVLAGCPVQPVM